MSLSVIAQKRSFAELFAALKAFEGFLFIVAAHMLHHQFFVTERPITLGAHVLAFFVR